MKSLLWWKAYLPWLNMLKFAAIFGHSIVTFSMDCLEPVPLKYLEITYALFGFILSSVYMLKFIERENELFAQEQQLQAKQTKKAN